MYACSQFMLAEANCKYYKVVILQLRWEKTMNEQLEKKK